ncbi:MAG: ABC transporter permease subunit [Rectinema sp.]
MPIPTKSKLWGRIHKYRFMYLMFLPIAVYFVMFAYYPFAKGITMSFQANRLIGKRPFVGLENYARVVVDPDFLQAILNSLLIGFVDMALYFALSLILALAVNELTRPAAKKTVQTISYLPYLFSWSVIGGIWILLFDDKGFANTLLGFLGMEPVFFLAEPGLARPLIVGMGVWRSIGYFAVLYLVSIAAISPTLFEAAQIDGAGRVRQIRKIILPSLRGTMKVILVLLAMGVLTHFDEIYVMQNPANKRMIRTLLVYIYETGIINFKVGTATAGAALVMVGTLVIVAITRKLIRYDEL